MLLARTDRIIGSGYAPVMFATNAANEGMSTAAGVQEPDKPEGLDLTSDTPLQVAAKPADGEGPCESCQ